MEFVLNSVQRSLLAILQDPTRSKILKVLADYSVHPEVLVEETGVSRTAIEKHLKQLLNYGILERRAQTYPRLRYVYSLTSEAEVLLDLISSATEQFADGVKEKWEDELSQIEQGYVFGALQKEEFEKIKQDFVSRLNCLTPEREEDD